MKRPSTAADRREKLLQDLNLPPDAENLDIIEAMQAREEREETGFPPTAIKYLIAATRGRAARTLKSKP
ncbi:hypothetical protein HZC21_02600 [Candidatus Peregrinibacteria bacterium]|nr:hypothetical protein [Candidatus Peregrinibacteria bacterium]